MVRRLSGLFVPFRPVFGVFQRLERFHPLAAGLEGPAAGWEGLLASNQAQFLLRLQSQACEAQLVVTWQLLGSTSGRDSVS